MFSTVYIPRSFTGTGQCICTQERVVFVGDNPFNDCQIWLHSADFDDLFASLDWLNSLMWIISYPVTGR